MIYLLLVMFVFAFIVTMIGFLLTTISRIRDRRSVNMVTGNGHRVVESIPVHGKRYVKPVAVDERRYVDPIPTSRRIVVVKVTPVSSGRLAHGNGTRTAKYTPICAIWGRFSSHKKGEPLPWSIVIIGLISIFILGLYIFTFVLPQHALINLLLLSTNPNASANTTIKQPTYHASQNLVRISQLDPAQYNSQQEYTLWAYSTCSAAAITEVINAYGHNYRVTDILKVEAQIGEITPSLGLLEDIGIQSTAARFGFKTVWGHNLSLDQLIDKANHGTPVIVSFPPDRYPKGHLVVVTGGDGNVVHIADSSIYNRHTLTRSQFLNWWGGFSAIVTPN